MSRNELLDIGLKVLGAAISILAVAIGVGGVVGEALTNGAVLAAVAGVLCLVIGIMRRR